MQTVNFFAFIMVRKFALKFLIFTFFLSQSCSLEQIFDKSGSDKNFLLFEFKTSQNAALAQDIRCEIKGDTIYAVTFSGTNLSSLKPTFLTEGGIVSVAGQTQINEQTVQNFNLPVTYSIKAKDGSIKQFVVKFSDTSIPALYITTNSNIAIQSKTTYVGGYLKIKDKITGDSLYGGVIEIRGRGNSTWNLPKKPYKIKLSKKASLLGMNESKQWVLLANYADKSLLRNKVGFELSRRIGLTYTPASKFVDVILNGKYNGNYELTEQIDVDKKKVNIAEQSTASTILPDISGGYLVEIDGFANTEAVFFNTPRRMAVSVHYPESDEINQEQRNYIAAYLRNFEDRLFSNEFDNPIIGYKQYFDVDSYINYYLVNEIMGNPDLFWSTYMYKNRNNDLIYTGPVWDFDIAANNDTRIGDSVNKLMLDAAHQPKQWINRLMLDRVFRNKVRKRWNEIYNDKLNTIIPFIDILSAQMTASQQKNFIKWPILNEKVYLNLQISGSYIGEVNYLKSYLTSRISWLNTQFNGSRFD